MTDSQDWWPADWELPRRLRCSHGLARGGHLSSPTVGAAPGTGAGLPAPSTLWPDSGNLDKARPAVADQAKYGQKLSWADLFVLTG